MKFEEWKMFIKESLSIGKLKTMGEEIKSKIEKDFDKVFVIPDFDTFEREGEPAQQSILFTDKKLRTFSFNYTTKGQLYSIDFWKSEIASSRPSITMYYNSGNISDLYIIVPEIAKNPVKDVDIKRILARKKAFMSETEEIDLDVHFEDSKPQKETDPSVKKAEKKLEDEYDFSDPATIFDDLKTYVNMVISGKQPSLLITGSPGVGKTYLVSKLLKDSGKEFKHVKGRSTAAGMYTTLWENNGKIIVFDDCDSVFSSDDAVNILKGALDSYGERTISWLTGRPLKSGDEKVPTSFDFTGKVIFISNLPQKKIDEAIKSRSFVIEVALTPEDMIIKMKKELHAILPEVPRHLKEIAMNFIERIAKKTDTLELNMRTLIKAVKIIDDVDDLKVAERLIMQQCSYK
jgi:hypothetical protein